MQLKIIYFILSIIGTTESRRDRKRGHHRKNPATYDKTYQHTPYGQLITQQNLYSNLRGKFYENFYIFLMLKKVIFCGNFCRKLFWKKSFPVFKSNTNLLFSAKISAFFYFNEKT